VKEPITIGMADLKLICYATRTTALQSPINCFIQTASCEAVRYNKFWNKKIHGWFHSHLSLQDQTVYLERIRLMLLNLSGY